MTDSPPSRHILVRGDKNIVMRTQPFDPVFYEVEPRTDSSILRKIMKQVANKNQFRNKNKGGTRTCNKVLSGEEKTLTTNVVDDVPFSVGSEAATKNLTLFAAVFVAVVVVGAVAFLYWVNVMESFDPVLENRAVYVSVFFIAAFALLSVMSYELFTMKMLSRTWFLKTQTAQDDDFHFFLMGWRRIFIWSFLLAWIGVVAYTTAVLSRRAEAFREQIVVNVVAGTTLLVSQYIYHRASSPAMKTFSLLMSVFVVGLMVLLIYAV